MRQISESKPPHYIVLSGRDDLFVEMVQFIEKQLPAYFKTGYEF